MRKQIKLLKYHSKYIFSIILYQTFFSLIKTLPDLYFSKPAMALISVDLPEPDGPQITTISF